MVKPFCHGSARLYFEYKRDDATALLPCSDEWRVAPSDALLDSLNELTELSDVAVTYN